MSISIIFKDLKTSNWLEWKKADKIWHIKNLNLLKPMFEKFKYYSDQKKIIFGFITYEAAPFFNNTLSTKSYNSKSSFPLGWFAVLDYKKATKVSFNKIKAPRQKVKFVPEISPQSYIKKTSKIKNYLKQGDSYQVNFSFRMRSQFKSSLKKVFLYNIKQSNLPYAAYIESKNFQICSLSPELFFKQDKSLITCKPMKGTIARGKYKSEDDKNFKTLKNSVKEKAENVMILDMVRNDLGQIAKINSVKPTKIYDIEKYAKAWQMVSCVTAKTNTDILTTLNALFPGASITGTPKRRTMQIITELEASCRSLYTGCIGAVYPGNKAVFNIAIRTFIKDKKNQSLEYGTGSAITVKSNIKKEYEECLLKAKWALFYRKPNKFDLLETMLLEEGKYRYLKEHLARLADSANYWQINYDKTKLKAQLKKTALAWPKHKLKVRLTVSQAGKIKITQHPFVVSAPDLSNFALAPYAVNSNERLLYHKTTNRKIYQKMLLKTPQFDVLMYNQKNEITESTIYNVALKIEGELFTPPISCGLLPGTMRANLIKHKKLKEKKLPLSLLKDNKTLYLFNSVRGMHKIKLNKNFLSKLDGLLENKH